MLSTIIAMSLILWSISALYLMNFTVTTTMAWPLLKWNTMSTEMMALFDFSSVLFFAVVLTIYISVLCFTTTYMHPDISNLFLLILTLFVFSMALLIFIPSLLFLMMGWDGLGMTSYLLVIYYNTDTALASGMLTALTNRLGDGLLVAAIPLYLYSGASTSFMALCLIAAMTKSAQMPFSAWLPAAMAAPTPVSALVHSSTLVTAGVYLLVRFSPALSQYLLHTLIGVGFLTCFMASMAALCEYDLKKIVALSTLSQLGLMMFCIGSSNPSMCFFHLMSHALFKALLFICCGMIIHSTSHTQDLRFLGSITVSMPMTAAVFNIANFSLCGVPFTAGFYSKDSIIESTLNGNMPIFVSLCFYLMVCATCAYTARLSWLLSWAPYKGTVSPTDESYIVLSSYATLGSGAVMGGAGLFWATSPTLSITFPPMMKMFTLTMMIMWVIYYMSLPMYFTFFNSTMWFMSLFSLFNSDTHHMSKKEK
uniref:NADH:ubiquinone reductase (H(+)-translocating) n=1 Tax=Flustrellidra hispida TaxID=97271 RepID=Q15K55_9BILA|nr:NADH dehydrogenase subunit 5 [Flustrellidra hispida]AAZ76747.1 NADH dehydrogenase subunit 5 [Flustrellidra hispida]